MIHENKSFYNLILAAVGVVLLGIYFPEGSLGWAHLLWTLALLSWGGSCVFACVALYKERVNQVPQGDNTSSSASTSEKGVPVSDGAPSTVSKLKDWQFMSLVTGVGFYGLFFFAEVI